MPMETTAGAQERLPLGHAHGKCPRVSGYWPRELGVGSRRYMLHTQFVQLRPRPPARRPRPWRAERRSVSDLCPTGYPRE